MRAQLQLSLEDPLDRTPVSTWDSQLRTVGLFAGIGGIELGLQRAGHESVALCEIDELAGSVLAEKFGIRPFSDVRDLDGSTLDADIVAGGFPCQDLSQAGRTAGIEGPKSGLVSEMFRIMDEMRRKPDWLLFENVPFMLQLDDGRAMHYLTSTLASKGWVWAYRLVDTRSFGIPHRRQRIIFLASHTYDPRCVLFSDDMGTMQFPQDEETAFGFYWTEGRRGLGWAVDAIPPLKGGSTIGVPSPPAIWLPSGEIVTPDIRDAERLQGFPVDWTNAGKGHADAGARWRMVGNAVSVPVAEWVGKRLRSPGCPRFTQCTAHGRWPPSAWGYGSTVFEVDISAFPFHGPLTRIGEFLEHPTTPLSLRASQGFRSRTREAKLRFPHGFLDAIDSHIETMQQAA